MSVSCQLRKSRLHSITSSPVAAIRLTMNALSSAGGKVTATVLQTGIG
jgi:hypothetical protein